MTIDGVANIDTGDNGGNMAQTNLDAVAEFKVLTSSYQAEYGRAVGAQVQVVTKSGRQRFPRVGVLVRPPLRLERQHVDSTTATGTPKPKSSRNDQGYTIGGPVAIPGVQPDRKKLFFFFNQEFQRRTGSRGRDARHGAHGSGAARAISRRASTPAATRIPYIRDYTTGLPCGAANTAGCFQDGGVLGKIPANRLYAPTLAALSLFPKPNATGQVGLQLQEPDAVQRAARTRRCSGWTTRSANNWRVHRPVHVPTRTSPSCPTASAAGRFAATSTRQRDLGRPGPQLDGVDHRHPRTTRRRSKCRWAAGTTR